MNSELGSNLLKSLHFEAAFSNSLHTEILAFYFILFASLSSDIEVFRSKCLVLVFIFKSKWTIILLKTRKLFEFYFLEPQFWY